MDVLVKILTSLGRLGCKISNEEQKWVYFNSAKLVYEGKLYLTMKTLLKNPLITLARSVVIVESELQIRALIRISVAVIQKRTNLGALQNQWRQF